MSRKQRPNRSRQQPSNSSTGPRVNAKVVIAAIVALIAIGIVWSVVADQNSASTPQEAPRRAEACTSTDKQYLSEPPMQIDIGKEYTATVEMVKGGEFIIQLYSDKAPRTVNSFVFLARDHFFDCVTFHRAINGFMAQSGDPTGTGAGGPGYSFANEISNLTFDKEGVVAMTHSSEPDSNGSQFFITFDPKPDWNGEYTIFGQVISGMEVVKGLKQRDPLEDPTFPGDAIETITITED